ncbi:MAG: hypothetical protein EZS28_012464 [Streblomastix strix]|uniref:RING-type domain-containing protein n=1 Tax=Streblomastix strix TaxID=222440 RepID=A0A5J4WBG4_9EUKA|nr:MAG: hypothetical protein EZS28_012464 [Streblomastix strix]
MSQEELNRLVCYKQLNGENSDFCTICQENINANNDPNKYVAILPCTHKYHRRCIFIWLRKQRRCPIDNIEVIL